VKDLEAGHDVSLIIQWLLLKTPCSAYGLLNCLFPWTTRNVFFYCDKTVSWEKGHFVNLKSPLWTCFAHYINQLTFSSKLFYPNIYTCIYIHVHINLKKCIYFSSLSSWVLFSWVLLYLSWIYFIKWVSSQLLTLVRSCLDNCDGEDLGAVFRFSNKYQGWLPMSVMG
jgi:hypothetical protein